MRLKNRKKSAAAIKSMKVGTDELKDLIKGAVKEAMGEEDDTGDDGSDTAAALDGITAEDMADIIEQAVDNANEKRKSRKDAGEEVGDLTADEVIQEAAEIIDSMTADEGMDDDEADPEGKDDDEADSDEKDDDEAASEDDAKRRKSAAFRRQVKSGTAPAQRKYSSLFMGGTASAKKQQKSVPPLVNLARAIKCLDVFGRHDPERAEFYAKKYYEDINAASAWLETQLGRKLGKSTYRQKYCGTGTQMLSLEQYPIVSVERITDTFTGETITDFDFNETGEIGVLFREDGWTYRGHIGGLAYDYIAPRKYLEVQYVAGYILPKDATEDHPATLPADLEAIVWYMIAQQWAIIENDAAGLSAFSISDVSWTFDKNISETWQSVISKYQRW